MATAKATKAAASADLLNVQEIVEDLDQVLADLYEAEDAVDGNVLTQIGWAIAHLHENGTLKLATLTPEQAWKLHQFAGSLEIIGERLADRARKFDKQVEELYVAIEDEVESEAA